MKKISRPQYARARRILEMIRQGTQTGQYPSASDFAGELEVCRRTILRDLDFLRDDEGAPIAYEPSRKGHYLSDVTWKLPAVELNTREVFAFAIARKLLDAFRGTPLEMDMATVLEKISKSMEGTVSLDVASLADHCTVVGEDYVVQEPAVWSALAGYVDRGEQIRMRYQKFDATISHYELEPWHLLAYHGNWYVVGRHVGKDRAATFAISRIRSICGTGAFFRKPQTFDAEAFARSAFGIEGDGKVLRVRLLFSARVAAYVRERVWHASQKVIERRDGSVELRLETSGWKELVRWILSWQPDVKVLAPVRLRKRVESKMRQALGAEPIADAHP